MDEGQLGLIAALRDGPVYGWISPSVFHGIGIEGDRAIMKTLPAAHNFVLGGFDLLAAMILHPDTLARDNYTPVMELASFQWQGPGRSLYLSACGAELKFDFRYFDPHELCSAALSVFGQ